MHNSIEFNTMGGNALKTVSVARFDLATIEAVKSDIMDKLVDLDLRFIRDAPNKVDFGDLDVLHMRPIDEVLRIIKQVYDPIECVCGDNMLSFAFLWKEQYYQVDMIRVGNFEMGQFYFGYGDVGNILGRMVRNSEIFLGSQGLFCREDYVPIILSDDPDKICDYLGLDYSTWKTFTEDQEIFTWIASSRFFVSSFHIRSKDKKKQKKRPMLDNYMNFIADKQSNIIENRVEEALLHFKKCSVRDEMRRKKLEEAEKKKKFNGSKLMKLTGCDCKQVGALIQKFKAYVSTENEIDFERWLDINDEDHVDACIIDFYEAYRK